MSSRSHNWSRIALIGAVTVSAVGYFAAPNRATAALPGVDTPYVVLGYNDLGMHCMNSDFSELMVLPPFNTLRAQLIRRGQSPDIETSTVEFLMTYKIASNTHASDKTNCW